MDFAVTIAANLACACVTEVTGRKMVKIPASAFNGCFSIAASKGLAAKLLRHNESLLEFFY